MITLGAYVATCPITSPRTLVRGFVVGNPEPYVIAVLVTWSGELIYKQGEIIHCFMNTVTELDSKLIETDVEKGWNDKEKVRLPHLSMFTDQEILNEYSRRCKENQEKEALRLAGLKSEWQLLREKYSDVAYQLCNEIYEDFKGGEEGS